MASAAPPLPSPQPRGKTRHLDPIEFRVPALLALCRSYGPDKECMVFDDRRLTYHEADRQSSRLARHLLESGIAKGVRVGMLFGNGLEFLITWLALTRIGAVAVPISTLSTPAEIQRIARHADLHLLIATDQYLHHNYVERIAAAFDGIERARVPYAFARTPYLREVWIWGENVPAWARAVDLNAPLRLDEAFLAEIESEISSSDPVSIIYTSGSTADPKGVIHSHGNFIRQATKLAQHYPPLHADDRLFAAMPFFWVGGLVFCLLNAMRGGATTLISLKTGRELLDFLERERASWMLGWPHIARALAADPTFAGRNFSAMRGGSLYEAIPEPIRPKDPTLIGTALGMTESSGPHTMEVYDLPEHLRSSFGTRMPGMEHRLVDVGSNNEVAPGEMGELHIRGNALMLGMVKRERSEVFDADGWYRTGDLCSWREEHLFFHGRVDDMIKTAGANVSPREIEAFLMNQPGIAQANVSAVPDPARGAVVGAILVPKPGVKLDLEAVRKAAARDLSSYKVPRVLMVLEASQIPMMSSSKADRRALVKLLHEEYLKQSR